MVGYHGEGKVQDEVFNLIGLVNSVSQRRILIAGLRYFASQTLVVSLRKRE